MKYALYVVEPATPGPLLLLHRLAHLEVGQRVAAVIDVDLWAGEPEPDFYVARVDLALERDAAAGDDTLAIVGEAIGNRPGAWSALPVRVAPHAPRWVRVDVDTGAASWTDER